MQNLDENLYQLENRALALQAIQSQQYENYSRAHREVHDDLRISHAILAQIQASAANLQTTIDEAQFSFANLPSFSNMLQTGLSILPCAILICVMAFLFPSFGARVLFLVVIGLFLWTLMPRNSMPWLSSTFKPQNELLWLSEDRTVMIEAFAMGCFITMAISRTWNCYRKRVLSKGHGLVYTKGGELPIRV